MSGGQNVVAGSETVLDRIQGMDAIEFEEFCAELWRRQGWDAEVRQASGDAGVDVVLRRNDGGFSQRAVLQAKRYGPENGVSGPEIQQYGSLRRQEDADFCAVVTTSYFTKPAKERADELDVRLVDGEDLVRLIDDVGAFDLLDEYALSEARDSGSSVEHHSTAGGPDSPNEKVSELRSIINDPSDWEEHVDAKAWEYVWNPTDSKKYLYGISALVGALVFYLLYGWGATDIGILAGLGIAVAGGYKMEEELRNRGTKAVDEYHDPMYEYATAEIEMSARKELGATGPNVTTYTMERTENADELVSVPRKYQVLSVVIDDASMGVVENAWISMPSVAYNSGQLTQEFFYDQVTRLNHEGGKLVIYLSDGSEHSWEADEIPQQAVQDIRDRIRAYK